MHSPSPPLTLLTAAALSLGLAAGCNPGEVVQQAQNAAKRDVTLRSLKELGLAYHNFHDAHYGSAAGKGAPESWEHLQEAGLSSEARQTLEREGYKLILGLEMPQVTIGTSNFMMAHPANPAGEAIVVGMLDGSARVVSQSEFNDLLLQQQPLLAEAIVIEPPAGAAPSASRRVFNAERQPLRAAAAPNERVLGDNRPADGYVGEHFTLARLASETATWPPFTLVLPDCSPSGS